MNWFEGALSVKAVMIKTAGRDRLVVDQKKKDKDTAFILRQAAQRQIPVERTREKIDQQALGAYPWRILAPSGIGIINPCRNVWTLRSRLSQS